MAEIINFSDFNKDEPLHLEKKESKHGRYLTHCRRPFTHWPPCYHLDCSTRTVTCKHCGEQVDAFDVLLSICDEEIHCLWEMRRYKAAKEEFEKIEAEWSLTIAEKRRIKKAMDNARYITTKEESREQKNE